MATRRDPRRPRRPRLIAATSVTFIALISNGHAHAQSAEAEALFNEGTKLMTQGELTKACAAFEASNQAEPRAGTLIELGKCREQTQQLASAWSAYKDALSRVKDPRKRDFATARATALEARLSYLTLSVSNESRVEGLTLTRNGKPFDPTLWNRALPIDGGDYLITGHAPGRQEWQTTAHVPVEGAKILIEVPKLEAPTQRTAPAPPLPPVGAAKPISVTEHSNRDAVPSTRRFTTKRKVALGVAGASVIGVIAGVVLGEGAKGKQHDAFNLCPDPATPCAQADQADALIQSGHSRAVAANIAFGIGAVAAIGAGLLWFTGSPVDRGCDAAGQHRSAPRFQRHGHFRGGEVLMWHRGWFVVVLAVVASCDISCCPVHQNRRECTTSRRWTGARTLGRHRRCRAAAPDQWHQCVADGVGRMARSTSPSCLTRVPRTR